MKAAYIAEKRVKVRKQLEEIKREGLVTCACGRRNQIPNAFRCFHCGEFYCSICSESHFGKKPAHYINEPVERYIGTDTPFIDTGAPKVN